MAVTIKDVAHEAGVSTATVSYILRGTEKFSYRPETIDRVWRAAEKLGYEANTVARLLRQKIKKLIGLTVDIQKPYLNPLVQAAYTEMVGSGYEPVLLDINRMTSDEPSAFMNVGMLAGVLSVDSEMSESIPLAYQRLRESVPVVALYPVASQAVDFVTTDRAAIAPIAVKHLVELGHRRIVKVMPAVGRGIGRMKGEMKLAGWKKALREHNIAPSEPLFLPRANSLQEMGQLMAHRILALEPRPTALVCDGDDVALSIMGGLARHGVRVPSDFSLISSGLSDLGQYSYPTLTTISSPASEIVQQAVKCLLVRIEERQRQNSFDKAHRNEADEERPRPQGQPAYRQLVKPKLIIRESTASPPREGFCI